MSGKLSRNMGVDSLFDFSARLVIRSVFWPLVSGACLILTLGLAAQALPQQPPAGSAVAKAVGEIKSLSGSSLTLSEDDGKNESIALPDNVRVVRIAPGATDLKNATPITVEDLQKGDRVLVQGKMSDDGKSMIALPLSS